MSDTIGLIYKGRQIWSSEKYFVINIWDYLSSFVLGYTNNTKQSSVCERANLQLFSKQPGEVSQEGNNINDFFQDGIFPMFDGLIQEFKFFDPFVVAF